MRKGKGKSSTSALEILSEAELKLKGGVHYALLGRNGTGKSSEQSSLRLLSLYCPLRLGNFLARLTISAVILRAISEKLIPGLPYSTKIAMLQQTSVNHRDHVRDDETLDTHLYEWPSSGTTVLQKVFESDKTRKETLREIAGKSESGVCLT